MSADVIEQSVLLNNPADTEELLGSLTTYNNNEGTDTKTQQLRQSARVYKKMKLDLTIPVQPEKPEKKEEVKLEVIAKKHSCRPIWTSEDKDIFFEALNEYGKDFEGIYSYICNKFKKRGTSEHTIRTKDQVRHLYYRSWHKISKYLNFSEGVKKVAQELYGLINYGEMRRKLRFVSEKSLLKLSHLIYNGAIAVRIKGKTIRIKTPMCRALRRLNQLDERYDELKLPSRICLELRPKNMYSYLKVQSMAQNPRLRTVLPLQKRLSTVILSVSKRWKTVEAEVYDSAVTSKIAATNDCAPLESDANVNKAILNPLLRFTPPSDYDIDFPSINLSEYFTRQSICLKSYENKLGIVHPEEEITPKGGSKKSMECSAAATSSAAIERVQAELSKKDVKEVMNTILALENTFSCSLNPVENITTKSITQTIIPKVENNNDDISVKELNNNITEIRKGWTLSDCGTVSIGDLYLMFGSDSKLVLEYSWDEPKREENLEIKETDSEEINNSAASNWDCNVGQSLRKLISLAKLHYKKNDNKCICGHICSNKSNSGYSWKNKSKMKNDYERINESNYEITVEENLMSANDMSIRIPPISNQAFFRKPTPMVSLITQLDSIQRLKPKYGNKKSRRPCMKQVVVERKLSLLPNNTENDHQIMRMNIIPQQQSNMPQTYVSKPIKIEPKPSVLNIETQAPTITLNTFTTDNNINASATVFNKSGTHETCTTPIFTQCNDNIAGVFSNDNCSTAILNTDNRTLTVLNEHELNANNPLPECVTKNEDSNAQDFINLGAESTPSTSPSRILKENDNQWINSEVADFSLSSFLGHLDSPSKPMQSVLSNDDSCLS